MRALASRRTAAGARPGRGATSPDPIAHAAIVGGPERCIESIRWYESQDVDFMILLVQAGNITHDDICDSLRRFGREVIPKFR